MPTWRRLVLAFAGVAALAVATADPAHACDCMTLKPLSPAVRREAAFIFTGTVVEISERNEHTTTTYQDGAKTSVRPLDRWVVLEVASAWRGVARARFRVLAEVTDCMFPFEIGGRYLVFAHRDARGRAWTNICTRTASLDTSGDIIRVLGTPSYRAKAGSMLLMRIEG